MSYAIKMVRDNIPQIANPRNLRGEVRYELSTSALFDEERLKLLRLKLAEEVAEYLLDKNATELSDVYAVVMELGRQHGFDLEEMRKGDKRGNFSHGTVMYTHYPGEE